MGHITHDYSGRAGRCHRCGCTRPEGTKAFCDEILPAQPVPMTPIAALKLIRDLMEPRRTFATMEAKGFNPPQRDTGGIYLYTHTEAMAMLNYIGDRTAEVRDVLSKVGFPVEDPDIARATRSSRKPEFYLAGEALSQEDYLGAETPHEHTWVYHLLYKECACGVSEPLPREEQVF